MQKPTQQAASDQNLYIGIDLGTSGARAIAINADGKPVGDGKCRIPESERRSPQAWWTATSTALESLLNEINRQRVKAIAVDATSGTVLPIDHQGSPLSDALMYNDPVDSPEILASIASVAPATSAVHGSSSALARAISLQNRFAGDADGMSTGQAATDQASTDNRTVNIVHQADWIVGQLSGHYGTSDESNALKTGYDPVSRRWPDWISATGMRTELLPAVVPCGTINRKISAACALQFQLPESTLLVTGATDGCASFLATGAAEIGDSVTALGTTITMKMLCNEPLFEPKYGIYSHRIGNLWLAGGASNSGGNVLAHYFTNEQIENYSRQIDTGKSLELNYYPLTGPGERFPHNDANWQPQLSPRPQSDVDFLHALFEGMASIEALGYRRLTELGAPAPASIRTVGGGTNNKQWTAIRKRQLPAPFKESRSSEAAVGMALLAQQAIIANIANQ